MDWTSPSKDTIWKTGLKRTIQQSVVYRRTLHTNKGEIHQKEITVINQYAANVSAPNFIKHTLKDLKAYIDSNTVVVGDFNTPLSPVDRLSKQKIKKKFKN
jgi:hypothetical protein